MRLLTTHIQPRKAAFRTAFAGAILLLVLGRSVSRAQDNRRSAVVSKSENSSGSAQNVTGQANDLLGRMTLEEKVGQLNQDFLFPDPQRLEAVGSNIRDGKVGSLLFVTDAATINRLQKIAVQESRLKIPILFGFDVIHGFKTIFPVPLAMASSWDTNLVEQVQTVAAREASSAGIRWTFAPMVDIARDPRWGRIVEGAGEDPYLGSAMASAQVRGFQGDNHGNPEHILACAKHFAGYGAADGGRDYDSSYIPEALLQNVYLKPFHAAEQAGVGSFMSAYMDLNDIPATGNVHLLQDVLRKDWGFRGFVVSDAEAVGNLVTHGFARDKEDAAFRAFTAGVNMEMTGVGPMGGGIGDAYATHLADLVRKGRVTSEQLDDAVRPILEAKIRLGLFEQPYVDEARSSQTLGRTEHRKLARIAAQRSAVLLRNESDLLPLQQPKLSSIAVIGPLADSQTDTLGGWSFRGDPKEAVTILQGIRKHVDSSVRIDYMQGSQLKRAFPSMFDAIFPSPKQPEWTDAQKRDEIVKATNLAKAADVTVLVLGEDALMSGEAASTSTLDLPSNQAELLHAVVATNRPVVLVLENGRPLNISWAAAHVPAILEIWHPGTEGGNAVADLLFGDAVPGGKLPVTWPRSEGQIPIYYAHNLTHQPDSAPEFTSRYWDIPSSPLYPFGYGLSYTRFTYGNLRIANRQVKKGERVVVSVDVTNAGSRTGDEVVQVYIHQQNGGTSRPVRELKGFQRVTLGAGETKTLQFALTKSDLSYWNSQSKVWVEDSSQFDVWAGSDSSAALHDTFAISD
jgi:beta-glucosidase